jgi:uncharacterized protein involved in response to NO
MEFIMREPIALWQLGFRPFFLFGCAFVVLTLAGWLAALNGWLSGLSINSLWHAHEMIHGFAMAIVMGFLLTASQNWSGTRGIHGWPLGLVTGTWLAGRLVFLLPIESLLVRAVIDLMFLPLALGLLTVYLRRSHPRNMIFIPVIAGLWLSNLAYHLAALGIWPEALRLSNLFAIHMIVLIISIISGRVVPFFTARALKDYRRRDSRNVEIATGIIIATFSLVHLFGETSIWAGVFGFIAGSLCLLRLGLWYDRRIWEKPILWILYIGNVWLVVGFYLSAFTSWQTLAHTAAIHAFTAGSMGTMIIGMISRVSLGHTGRAIVASPWTLVAYALVIGGAMLRVGGALWATEWYLRTVMMSGIMWSGAFVALLIDYWPILLAPRVDGHPG